MIAQRFSYLEEGHRRPSSAVADEGQLPLYALLGTLQFQDGNYSQRPIFPTAPNNKFSAVLNSTGSTKVAITTPFWPPNICEHA